MRKKPNQTFNQFNPTNQPHLSTVYGKCFQISRKPYIILIKEKPTNLIRLVKFKEVIWWPVKVEGRSARGF